ncbi:hypothetical protein BGZ57DRAFT_966735 [Hyaloscypha finlandica]|nr:hypothetical protein BGZ57DRAFT_966735 [Hyaloscypha finlandica]
MSRNIVLFFFLICASHVLAKPHQAIKPARYRVSNSSSYTTQHLPSSSSTLLNTTSSGLTSITRTVTVVTTGITGATITEIEFPTTIDTAGDVSTITSTLSDSGNGNGVSTTSGGLSASTPPDANPCSSSTNTKQHPTKTMSGANAVETMTISPGEKGFLLHVMENYSEEIEYVEVRYSTWYKSAGASRPTNISPDTGEQGMETTSAPTTSSSDSTNAGAWRQNGSGRGKMGARAH